MELTDFEGRLRILREQRARIDYAIKLVEAQKTAYEAQKRAEEKGAEVLKVESCEGGSYVLQKVKCGKPSCHCAKPGGELHGPYWYYYYYKDGKRGSKYIGKNKPGFDVLYAINH